MDDDRRPADATARVDADASLELSRQRMVAEMAMFRVACDRAARNGRDRVVYNVMAGHWCDHADGKCSRFKEMIMQIARSEMNSQRGHKVTMMSDNCSCPRTRCRSLIIEVEAEIENGSSRALNEPRSRHACSHCEIA